MAYHLSKRRKKKIKLSINRDIAVLLTLAEQKGFLHDQGLNFEYVETPYAYVSMQMLIDGEVDIATLVETNFAYMGYMKPKHPIKAFVSIEQRTADNILIGKCDATYKDLIGAKVGFTPRSSSHTSLMKYLDDHEISKADIYLKPYSPQAISNALLRGEVDAISIWQPHIHNCLTALKELGLPHTFIKNDGYYVGEVVLASQKKFMVQNAKDIKKLLLALRQAESYLKENPQMGVDILATKMKVLGANKYDVYQHIFPKLKPVGENYMDNIGIISDWIRENDTEFLGKDVPNYTDYIDNIIFNELFPEQ